MLIRDSLACYTLQAAQLILVAKNFVRVLANLFKISLDLLVLLQDKYALFIMYEQLFFPTELLVYL